MTQIKTSDPIVDQIEKDFLDAIKRIQDGDPINKKLKKDKVNGGLKLTISNVALEAGRSRTLIGMDNCRYPQVREIILLSKSGKNTKADDPRTYTELIQRLRADVADLKVQVKQLQAEVTAHFLLRMKAEKEAEREREAKARLLKKIADSEKVVALNVTKNQK